MSLIAKSITFESETYAVGYYSRSLYCLLSVTVLMKGIDRYLNTVCTVIILLSVAMININDS